MSDIEAFAEALARDIIYAMALDRAIIDEIVGPVHVPLNYDFGRFIKHIHSFDEFTHKLRSSHLGKKTRQAYWGFFVESLFRSCPRYQDNVYLFQGLGQKVTDMLNRKQHRLYECPDNIKKKFSKIMYKDIVRKRKIFGIASLTMWKKIREIYNLTQITKHSFYDNCVICQVKFKEDDDVKELSCNHQFHPGCLDDALKYKQNCPTCRKAV
jgi:hypothetical protein